MRRSVILTLCMLGAVAAALAQAPGQPAQVQTKKTKTGPGPKTAAEQQAVQALLQAQTPDDRIKAADELVTKFPMTDFKSLALEIEAEAYQGKGDNAKAVVYGEQALAADPKNVDADNLLANVIAGTTRENDLDKDQKLAKAKKYAQDALDQLNTGEKPWMYADAAWPKEKAYQTSQAYQALGNVALVGKKTDEAIEDFQKGVDASPDPLLILRLGRALAAEKKYTEAIAWDDKVINNADVPDQYKNYAKGDKSRFELMAKNAGGAK